MFELLKCVILKSFKYQEKQLDSHWVRDVDPETFNVSDSVLDAVKNRSVEPEHRSLFIMLLT